MKRTSILASTAAVSLFSVVLIQACSGDEGDDEQTMQPNQPGQGGMVSAVGGSGAALGGSGGAVAAVGGSTSGQGGSVTGQGGGTPANQGGTGGTPAQGGTGGTPAQGGSGGAPAMGAACLGSPSDGLTCTVTCNDDCGIHNLGARVCACPGAEVCDPGQVEPCYDCASCAYTANANHPLLVPPTAAFPPCAFADDAQEDDASGCMENARCQSIEPEDGPERFCGCLANEWSCDSKPGTFMF